LQPNVSAEAEATAREISELKSRLNAQFSPALKLIQQLEELLKQQQAGLAEKEIERQKEIVAVKEGRKVVSQPTAALPSSSRVSVTAVASTPTPQFHQAYAWSVSRFVLSPPFIFFISRSTVAAPKAALPFLPQARQQIGAASSAQHDQAIAKPTAPEPVVKSVVPTISQEERTQFSLNLCGVYYHLSYNTGSCGTLRQSIGRVVRRQCARRGAASAAAEFVVWSAVGVCRRRVETDRSGDRRGLYRCNDTGGTGSVHQLVRANVVPNYDTRSNIFTTSFVLFQQAATFHL
jgi:hypothetical protein